MLLYILSEDPNDTDFYDLLVRKLLPEYQFQLVPFRITNKVGHKNVTQGIRRLLSILKRQNVSNTFLVISVDNDRRKIHPTHHVLPQPPSSDAGKDCRFCELNRAVQDIWGKDISNYPAKYAFAIPVQMLESWLLQMSKNTYQEEMLPPFDEKDATISKTYYKTENPPKQLKDLWQQFKDEQALTTKEEGLLSAIESLNLNQMLQQSPSFAQFHQQIQNWT